MNLSARRRRASCGVRSLGGAGRRSTPQGGIRRRRRHYAQRFEHRVPGDGRAVGRTVNGRAGHRNSRPRRLPHASGAGRASFSGNARGGTCGSAVGAGARQGCGTRGSREPRIVARNATRRTPPRDGLRPRPAAGKAGRSPRAAREAARPRTAAGCSPRPPTAAREGARRSTASGWPAAPPIGVGQQNRIAVLQARGARGDHPVALRQALYDLHVALVLQPDGEGDELRRRRAAGCVYAEHATGGRTESLPPREARPAPGSCCRRRD